MTNRHLIKICLFSLFAVVITSYFRHQKIKLLEKELVQINKEIETKEANFKRTLNKIEQDASRKRRELIIKGDSININYSANNRVRS
ncbi:hypothetical protein ACRASX_07585 [Flavobacterium sp. TMP13]|uniref:hypothetical protein n=1 Tax=Flavobacterium sp. TMP13 TaxID=3425950 RepID=UPI003D7732D9